MLEIKASQMKSGLERGTRKRRCLDRSESAHAKHHSLSKTISLPPCFRGKRFPLIKFLLIVFETMSQALAKTGSLLNQCNKLPSDINKLIVEFAVFLHPCLIDSLPLNCRPPIAQSLFPLLSVPKALISDDSIFVACHEGGTMIVWRVSDIVPLAHPSCRPGAAAELKEEKKAPVAPLQPGSMACDVVTRFTAEDLPESAMWLPKQPTLESARLGKLYAPTDPSEALYCVVGKSLSIWSMDHNPSKKPGCPPVKVKRQNKFALPEEWCVRLLFRHSFDLFLLFGNTQDGDV